MPMADRLFWCFCLTFYGGVMLLAVYMNEAGIAALFGWLFGTAFEMWRHVRTKRRKAA